MKTQYRPDAGWRGWHGLLLCGAGARVAGALALVGALWLAACWAMQA